MCWSRSRSRTPRRRRPDGPSGGGGRSSTDDRSHLLLHARSAVHQGCIAGGCSVRSSISTRSGSIWVWSSPMSTSSGISPRMICRFWISSFRVVAAAVGLRDRLGSAGGRKGLRRLSQHAAGCRRHRACQCELAVADEDPPDGDRREPVAPWYGTTCSRSSGWRSSTAGSTWPPRPMMPSTARCRPSPIGWGTSRSRHCPNAKRCPRW